MDSFTLYRERIGETLTRRLADAIEQEVVSIEEAAEIAHTIRSRIDTLNNHKELMDFLDELAHKWTLFGPVLVMEQGQINKAQEEISAQEISSLIKSNRIDEALDAAEKATRQDLDVPTEPQIEQQPASPQPEPVAQPESAFQQESVTTQQPELIAQIDQPAPPQPEAITQTEQANQSEPVATQPNLTTQPEIITQSETPPTPEVPAPQEASSQAPSSQIPTTPPPIPTQSDVTQPDANGGTN